ncbi:unnamed protein product [Allacma fusca]|uniref:Uncharacterized protein n=1 Tax=Allacma fusca TaxID=39272 RepID=A0A8J2MB63_9HEXA|nr:unnamed protein product [Allacma fusca]
MINNGKNQTKQTEQKNVKRASQNQKCEPVARSQQDTCCSDISKNGQNKAPLQKKDIKCEPLTKNGVNTGTSIGKQKQKCTIQVIRECCAVEDPSTSDSLVQDWQPPNYATKEAQTIGKNQIAPKEKRLSKNAQTSAADDSAVCLTRKTTMKCIKENKCKNFKEHDHPLMLRYRAVLVDAKPTLVKLSEARLKDPKPVKQQMKCEAIQVAPIATRSTCANLPGTGSINEEFQKLMDQNLAILWIIGYTQASVEANKRRCLNVLTQNNNLGLISLEKELQEWYGNKRRYVQEPDDVQGKIIFQGKRLALKVIDQKMPLTLNELCQGLKLAILSNYFKNPNLHGFFLDNFPLNVREGEESEEVLIPSVVCLYFESSTWSDNKSVPPKIVNPKYKLRSAGYSENAAEATADHFGYKTIKILNTEELEEIQIHDIDLLVKKHLEGHGLELHKIAKHVHQHRDTNPDGTSRTITEFASKIVVDHRDFAEKNNGRVSKQEQRVSRLSQPYRPRGSKPMTPTKPNNSCVPQNPRNSRFDNESSKRLEQSSAQAQTLPQKHISNQPMKGNSKNVGGGADPSGYLGGNNHLNRKVTQGPEAGPDEGNQEGTVFMEDAIG